jgi:hypothetical protein
MDSKTIAANPTEQIWHSSRADVLFPAPSASPASAIRRQVIEHGNPACFDVEPDNRRVPRFALPGRNESALKRPNFFIVGSLPELYEMAGFG